MKDIQQEELDQKQKNKYKIIRIIIQIALLAIILGACIAITVMVYPYMMKINDDPGYRQIVIDKIESFGSFSWAIILLAQIFQTILAVIPSGPIVMISGMMYNPFVSVILCIIGQTIGGIIVFFLVKLLGYKFIALFFNPDKLKENKILANETRSEVLIFGYLLIPALPKDIIAFLAPFTKITWYKFGLISLIARIPMTIVTVFMGSSLITGDYFIAIILAVFSTLLAAVCFIFNKRIVNYLDKLKEKNKK